MPAKESHDAYLQRISLDVKKVVDSILIPLETSDPVNPVKVEEFSLVREQLPGAVLFLDGIPRRGGCWPTQCVPDKQLFRYPLTEAQSGIVAQISKAKSVQARQVRLSQAPPWYRSSPSILPDGTDKPDVLASLRGSKWLNDITVDTYCILIHWWQSTYRIRPGSDQPTSLILPARTSRGINANGIEREGLFPRKLLHSRSLDLFSFEYILIPYNFENWHWIAVAADIRTRKIYVFDYLPSEKKVKRCEAVFTSVQKWLVEHEKLDGQDMELDVEQTMPWAMVIPEVDVQLNGHDCGPLMLQTIMNVCRLQNLDVMSSSFEQCAASGSMDQFPSPAGASRALRDKMAIELIQHKLVLRTSRDDRPMWIDPTKRDDRWQRSSMLSGFYDMV